MSTSIPSYKGHRYPPEIINHCVWLYFRFPLSFREVEEMMLERGVVVSYETIRRWCAKFGQAYANQLRRRRPRPGDKWHVDEVFIRINARAGAHAVGAVGAVPPELLGTFEEHEVWFVRDASLRWFKRHGLEPWPLPDAYSRDNPAWSTGLCGTSGHWAKASSHLVGPASLIMFAYGLSESPNEHADRNAYATRILPSPKHADAPPGPHGSGGASCRLEGPAATVGSGRAIRARPAKAGTQFRCPPGRGLIALSLRRDYAPGSGGGRTHKKMLHQLST